MDYYWWVIFMQSMQGAVDDGKCGNSKYGGARLVGVLV